jgi:hypothetical protein
MERIRREWNFNGLKVPDPLVHGTISGRLAAVL